MMERMDSLEYVRWKAFFRIEPFGCEVEDYRFGKLAAIHTGTSPLEHFPGYHPEEREETLARVRGERMKLKMMNHSGFHNTESEQE